MKFTVANKDIERTDAQHVITKIVKSKKNRSKALAKLATMITKSGDDEGAIIITKNEEGYKFGVSNLTLEEVKELGCILIHFGFTDFKSF